MAQVDAAPLAYPDSPSLDLDESAVACRGCGDLLSEGKAFELAGHRWHIQCFRCHSCGALLDSDANLLLLGDGSLICNDCTYSCSACGNKIEDLAILTGDQAFCSSCFRCRNCKKKIENLRYARTSQGIFCMSCHETLMARRRKKSRAATKPGQSQPKEKALPLLPPGAASQSAFSPDLSELETPPSTSQSGTPAVQSPPLRQESRREMVAGDGSRGASPYVEDGRKGASPVQGSGSSHARFADVMTPEGPTLPASTYGESRPSTVSRGSEDGLERGFLPLAFDPSPSAGPPPITRKAVPTSADPSPQLHGEQRSRDYFGKYSAKPSHRDVLRDEGLSASGRSTSTEREQDRFGNQPKASPHILSQDKGRPNKASENSTPALVSAAASPAAATPVERPDRSNHLASRDINQSEAFKLQDVPLSKKTSVRGSREAQSPTSPVLESKSEATEKLTSPTPSSLDSPGSSINPFEDPKLKDGSWSGVANRPVRGDSLAGTLRKATTPTSDAATPTATITNFQTSLDRQGSVSSMPSSFADAQESLSRDNSVTKPPQSPGVRGSPPDVPPPRASSRQNQPAVNGEFTAPRDPPVPPPVAAVERHRKNQSSVASAGAEARLDDASSTHQYSAGLPKQSMDAPFSMEEEMARIMSGEAARQKQAADAAGPSVLRKMSNAVKHGRSFSDRGLGATGRSPGASAIDISSPLTISSPMLSSPTGKDSSEQLSAQLRRAQARIAELETEVSRLEEKVNTSTEIKAANIELREKRSTMVVLDTQRELVVRELEVMTEHLAKAKDNNQTLDLTMLGSDILKDFADSLQKLKNQMGRQIEDLMHKRNELTQEITNLIQMKDKGFQEYETLSNKNAQLQEMNTQILHNIQDMYKSNREVNGAAPAPNGLGIYHAGGKVEVAGPSEIRNLNLVSTDPSLPNLLQETEAEPATVLVAPQVVNIRKGQPKKFNWRKGGESLAKNVTKGIKGAFASDRMTPVNENPYAIGMPYSAMTAQAAPGSDQGSINGKQNLDPARSGSAFALFGQKAGGLKAGGLGNMKDTSSTNLVDASVLFGSELSDRCEFEKRIIPGIVARCIEEVESRGMDMEGIYRKSGGSGQVKVVQQGFERDNQYDISDVDLDIHAVTSALKQYFRKLPNPLITFEVYDGLLDAGRIQDKEKQTLALRATLDDLPTCHRDCLEYLIQHLARVMAHESSNLMTSLNLAVVFAPTIMRPESIEREMSDMQAQRQAIQALLEQHATVFPED